MERSIKEDLHQRAPWLMVDEVIEITDNYILTQKNLSESEVFFQGHFPEAPVVPGSMLQEMTTQSAAILIARKYNPIKNYNTKNPMTNIVALGVLSRVYRAKYKGFARPSDHLEIRVELTNLKEHAFRFKGKIFKNQKLILENEFGLVNIPSISLKED